MTLQDNSMSVTCYVQEKVQRDPGVQGWSRMMGPVQQSTMLSPARGCPDCRLEKVDRDGQGMNNKFGDIYGSGRGKQLNVPDKGKVHTNRDHHSQPRRLRCCEISFTLQGLSSTNLQLCPLRHTLPPTLPLPLISCFIL
jgi:hypothetical protein